MAEFDLGEGVRKFFLMGVGAVATGVEKSREIVNELVEKGELTVKQGKELNEELTIKAGQALEHGEDDLLRARMSMMTPAERAAYAERVAKLAFDLDEGNVTPDDSADKDEDNDEA